MHLAKKGTLDNKRRPVTKGYYHSYNPNKIAQGRNLLTQSNIDEKMKHATTSKVTAGKLATPQKKKC